ncbi:putative transcription factor interactor and regulator CCHC(Zn) family [Helianthus anomalus]
MMEEFCPPHEQQKLEEEFWALKQIDDDNLAYTTRFKQLSFIVPHLVLTTDRMIRKYINGLPPSMRDTIEAAKLDNIETVYRLAASLNNNRVRDKQIATPTSSSKIANQIIQQSSSGEGKKRKFQDPGCNAVVPAANPNPVTPENTRKPYAGIHPKCTTCNRHHPTNSNCRHCTICNRFGHDTTYCLTNSANKVRACFKCGDTTHLRPQCPLWNQERQPAQDDNKVIDGTLLH